VAAKLFLAMDNHDLGALCAQNTKRERERIAKKNLQPLMRLEVGVRFLMEALESDHFFLALGSRHRSEPFDFTGYQRI
jgi:hypothetical protein